MIHRLWWPVVCLLVCTASAQTSDQTAVIWDPPVLFKATDKLPKGSVPNDIVSKLRVSGASVVLEETKLIDMQAQLGGTIGGRGDAGDYLEWLCMYGADDRLGWVLWLTSGEIDAGAIGGFLWRRVPPGAKVDKRCRRLPDAAVELPLAVRLGMPEGELLHVLGQPTSRHSGTLLYVHEEEKAIRNEPYTETNILVVLIRNGVVWAVEASKSTVS